MRKLLSFIMVVGLRGETLFWDANPASDGVVAYQVYVSTNTSPFVVKASVYVSPLSPSYGMGDLLPNVYSFRVTALNAIGESQPSATVGLVKPASAPCTYSVSPTSVTYPSYGGSGVLTMTTQSQCSWTVANVPSWISIPRGPFTNSWRLDYTVLSNPYKGSRSATMIAGGMSFVVSQQGRKGKP